MEYLPRKSSLCQGLCDKHKIKCWWNYSFCTGGITLLILHMGICLTRGLQEHAVHSPHFTNREAKAEEVMRGRLCLGGVGICLCFLLWILCLHPSCPLLVWPFLPFHFKKLLGRSVVSDSVRSYGQQLTRLLCPRDSLGKNIGVGCHFLLLILRRGDF